MPALLNISPLTLDDLCFDLLPVGALQDQTISVDGCLHGITNYQTVSGIAGMPTQSFTPAKVHHISDPHLINGVFEASAFDESFVRTHLQQLASLKLLMCTSATSNRAQENRKTNGDSQQSE